MQDEIDQIQLAIDDRNKTNCDTKCYIWRVDINDTNFEDIKLIARKYFGLGGWVVLCYSRSQKKNT